MGDGLCQLDVGYVGRLNRVNVLLEVVEGQEDGQQGEQVYTTLYCAHSNIYIRTTINQQQEKTEVRLIMPRRHFVVEKGASGQNLKYKISPECFQL